MYPGEKIIHFKQGPLHAEKILSFMLLEQLCIAKIVRTSPYYDCKKNILFQYEFSYNREVRPRLNSNVSPHVFSRL